LIKMMKRRMVRRRVILRKGKCPFCQERKTPDYKDSTTLRRLITDRGRIVDRGRSGVCAKHQRKLAREIKRARYLALLPFMSKI
jgi:small subunit ribosomal protein S18